MSYSNFNRQCDNFDHEGSQVGIQAIALREEFGGGIVDWCKACRERDSEMIVPECGNCGSPLADNMESCLAIEIPHLCNGCLYLEMEDL